MTFTESLLGCLTKDVPGVVAEICTEAGIEPKLYTDFISTGGVQYILEKLSSEIYLTPGKLEDPIRYKLLILYTFETIVFNWSNIFCINDHLSNSSDKWSKSKYSSEKESLKGVLRKELLSKFRSCSTCVDRENGCRGQDKECCRPEFEDWRGLDDPVLTILGVTAFID